MKKQLKISNFLKTLVLKLKLIFEYKFISIFIPIQFHATKWDFCEKSFCDPFLLIKLLSVSEEKTDYSQQTKIRSTDRFLLIVFGGITKPSQLIKIFLQFQKLFLSALT